ncbi:MAG: FAD:protein FMN transferase [Phycisphaerales bacterium]
MALLAGALLAGCGAAGKAGANGAGAPGAGAPQAAAATTAATPALQRFEYRRIVMGADCNLVLYAPDQERADAAARAAFARLAQIEEALSDWMPASETRRLPATAGTTVRVGPDLANALAISLAFARDSGGAFDPTVGPLTALSRAARKRGTPPTPQEWAQARARCGWEGVAYDPAAGTLTMRRDGVALDFGAIGQGLGADAALRVLAQQGIASALVDMSGDIVVSAPPPGHDAWHVSVDDGEGRPPIDLALAHAAVTTSGDRFQHTDTPGADGTVVRRSHIFDPRTGEALTTRTAVTVLARTATDADALATALCVLGPEGAAPLLARHPDACARWLQERPGAAPVERTTANWSVRLLLRPVPAPAPSTARPDRG